ncbi:MAG: hypothetical protein ABI705_06190 [Aestuariivirga sp.]
MMAKSPTVIEVHLRTAEQLFNSFDPSPFHERDLDDQAERYIAGWAREIKGTGRLKVIVTLPKGAHNTEGAVAFLTRSTTTSVTALFRLGRSLTSFCALAGDWSSGLATMLYSNSIS